MGNYKFRFSDMIPNAWFYKLKDMSKNRPKTSFMNPTNTNKKHSPISSSSSSAKEQPPHLSEQRKSYHFTRDLTFQPIQKTEPPPRRRRNRRSRGCTCRVTKPDPDSSLDISSPSTSDPDSVLTEYGSGNDVVLSCSGSCQLSTENDVVIDLIDENNNPLPLPLPSIITNKNEGEKNKYGSLSVKLAKENIVNSPSPVRRLSSSSPGVKLRTNSPRIVNRRIQGRRSVSSRRSVSESVAVVKSSKDPMKDFRESMVEMIVENNIRASRDLEELLACYLSLNSDEYHDVIVNVFKQIWFEFIHLRIK